MGEFNPISRIIFNNNPMKYISWFTGFAGESFFHSQLFSIEWRRKKTNIPPLLCNISNEKVAIFSRMILYLTVEKISYNHRPQNSLEFFCCCANAKRDVAHSAFGLRQFAEQLPVRVSWHTILLPPSKNYSLTKYYYLFSLFVCALVVPFNV